ncbi:MAG: tyrosine-type recombinase/integrase, partial [Aestuariivita sp.]|nr:tyrosine-type recombinase/integrase [Aestuariivita sp.]
MALLFMGGLRRSEAAALRWGDLADGEDGLLLVRVQASKTNQDGATTDLRVLKGAFVQALRDLRDLRSGDAPDSAPVIGLKGQRISQRFTALGKAAGLPVRLTGHSGRVGLASELIARGASTAEVMLAGNWKSARMVTHYGAA